MKNIVRKSLPPSANLFSPLPTIMVSTKGFKHPFDKDNIITIARATSLTTNPPTVCISVKKTRFSHEQIMQSNEFVINFVSSELCYEADWCGVKSGRDFNKFEECKLTAVSMEKLHTAPAIGEANLSLGCKVIKMVEIAEYSIFIGEVVSTEAKDEAMQENHKLNSLKIDTIAFDSIQASYRHVGNTMHPYGYSLQGKAENVLGV